MRIKEREFFSLLNEHKKERLKLLFTINTLSLV